MASFSIQKRQKKDGSARYKCLVRIKKKGKVVYSEARTFSKKIAASAWGKRKVLELEENGQTISEDNITLRELISKYLTDPDISIGRSKKYSLNMISDCNLAKIAVKELAPQNFVSFCKDRKLAGAGPSTINQDISYIRSVLKLGKPVWGIDVDDSSIQEVIPTLYNLKFIAKSNRRTRRPTTEEISLLENELSIRSEHRSSKIPYLDIFRFSILSCMRVGEVCSILWEDVDTEQKAVKVRDRKDPRKKEGNHMMVPLLGGAWEIIQSQPKKESKVFPYNPKSVSAGFQRVRNRLGIEDLRYHDLRREGASRLFEKGYVLDEVAQVTGHRDINTLWQIYTELFPKRLHDKSLPD